MIDNLVACKACGQQVANSAKICPHCGLKRTKTSFGFKVVIVIIAVAAFNVVAANLSVSSSRTSTVPAASSAKVQSIPAVDLRPADQKRFEEICSQYREEYEQGTNEIQQSAARNSRKNTLQQLGIKSAQNWIGTLNDLSTNNDGKAVIVIELESGSKIRTWNNAFSDIGDDTLIPPESTVFMSLMNLKEGAKVKFSGTFFPTSDTDYLRVTGMNTRDAMEMRNSGFLMKFTSIEPLQ